MIHSSITTDRRDVIKYGITAGIAGVTGYIGNDNIVAAESGDGSGEYPTEPITIIIPWSQGGGTDRSMRATTPTWSELLDAEFIVENYPGGSTQVGGERIYEADNDGYTIGMWNLPQMQATWLFQNAPYNADDFDYFGTHHWDPTMWFAPPDSPYADMAEFIEYARDHEVTVGTTAAIGNTAMSALLVQEAYDLDLTLVNLEGGSQTRQSVMAGDVDAAINQPWAFNPDHSDEVLGLGTHTSDPQNLWPDTPSFADLGLTEIPLVEDGWGQWKLMVTPGGFREEYPQRFETLAETYAAVFEREEFVSRVEQQGNLNEILRYKPPEETRAEVDAVSETMETYSELFENFS